MKRVLTARLRKPGIVAYSRTLADGEDYLAVAQSMVDMLLVFSLKEEAETVEDLAEFENGEDGS